jgi:hypothetical protein
MDTYAAVEWVHHHAFHFFERDSVDFVVDVNALYILAVTFDSVNQVIYVVVSIESDVRIVNLIFLHDHHHHLTVNLR